MKKKIIILILAIIGIIGLSSCDTLMYTTPVYYEYPPRPVVVRPTPPPPPYYRPPVNPGAYKPHKPVQNNKPHKGRK